MTCFVALGGNVGDVSSRFEKVCEILRGFTSLFEMSPVYRTRPVSAVPQEDFLNACCRFQCNLSVFELFSALGEIERLLGKVSKGRDDPRPIDLDLLFFGEQVVFEHNLIVPHPRWHERMFVVRPLADLTKQLPFGIEVEPLLERLNETNPNW